MRLFLVLAVLLLPHGYATCQQAASEQPADGGTTEVMQSIYVPPLPHAPFTLKLHTEWVRVLPDGSTITLTNDRRIARDLDGRLFEERRGLMPPHGDAETPLAWLQYADPRTRTLYNCSPATHVCHMLVFNAPSIAERPLPPAGVHASQAASTTEKIDLGHDTRNGVAVQGTRLVTTIRAGSSGNSKPIRIERQFWYSEDLGINVDSIRSDPRIGVQSFTVTDLDRSVPNPATFAIPSEYRVVDDRPPTATASDPHD